MKYHSTRGTKSVNFNDALSSGLAENGGLFVPDFLPDLSELITDHQLDHQSFSAKLLAPFLIGSTLENDLETIIAQALNFPIDCKFLSDKLSVLELFHGPTLSFKDFGARFLANCMAKSQNNLSIFVATSGDTGSAVASSFYGIDNINVYVLFPKNKVTQRQQAQICCFDRNIHAIEVEGTFDDCQRLVKQAFSDPIFNQQLTLSTANSINIARLLPQMTYYAFTAVNYFKKHRQKLNFVIPAGNLGNATACVYAREMQLPIGQITLATNANITITDYINTGEYTPRESIQTLANAMDVGAPSNFERLHDLYKSIDEFRKNIAAIAVSDVEIKQAIIDCSHAYNYMLCPHTATAFHAANHLASEHQCIVSTAHPAKFENVIEPILAQKIPMPKNLKILLERKQTYSTIAPNLKALQQVVFDRA